jgi:hypothetical protein
MSDLKTLAADADITGATALTDQELDDVVAGGSPLLFEYCATGTHIPRAGDISQTLQIDLNRSVGR